MRIRLALTSRSATMRASMRSMADDAERHARRTCRTHAMSSAAATEAASGRLQPYAKAEVVFALEVLAVRALAVRAGDAASAVCSTSISSGATLPSRLLFPSRACPDRPVSRLNTAQKHANTMRTSMIVVGSRSLQFRLLRSLRPSMHGTVIQ